MRQKFKGFGGSLPLINLYMIIDHLMWIWHYTILTFYTDVSCMYACTREETFNAQMCIILPYACLRR